jgi:hypothetical protein
MGAVAAERIKTMIQLSGGQGGIDSLARQIAQVGSEAGPELTSRMSEMARRSFGQKVSDAVVTTMINGMLWNPATHGVNLASNFLVAAGSVTERAAGRALGAPKRFVNQFIKRSAVEDGIATGEAQAMVMGALSGISDAFRAAWKSFKTGMDVDLIGKVDAGLVPPISAESFRSQNPIGKAMTVLSTINTLPGRALMAEDAFAKTVNYRMQVAALAVRDAARKGLAGEARAAAIDAFMKNPPDHIRLEAQEFARENTFTKGLEGWQASLQDTLTGVRIGQFPVLRVFVPFIRTPMNIVNYAVQRNAAFQIPSLLSATSQVRSDLAAGGVRAEMAQARLALSTTAMGTVGALTAMGYVTGRGPTDPDVKRAWEQAGNKEYSAMIGGKPVPLEKVLGPYGMVLGMAADLSMIVGALPEAEQEKAHELIAASAALMADSVTPEFLTENIGELLEAIAAGDRGDGAKLSQLVSKSGEKLLPFSSLGRTIRNETDPVKRLTMADPKATVETFDLLIKRWKNMIPGLSDELPPLRNLFGEVIPLEPGVAIDDYSPIASMGSKPDPVWDEFVRLRLAGGLFKAELLPGQKDLTVSMPSKTPMLGNVPIELDDKQYDQFVQLSAGIGLKPENNPSGSKLTLKQYLEREITKGYPEASAKNDDGKRIWISSVVQAYRKAALGQLLEDNKDLHDQREAAQKAMEGRLEGMFQ